MLGFVAGAAAVILSDPDKREKASELIDKTKMSALNTVNKVADTVKEKTNDLQSQITDTVSKVEDAVKAEIEKTENKEV
jgi:gas vesicle protein